MEASHLLFRAYRRAYPIAVTPSRARLRIWRPRFCAAAKRRLQDRRVVARHRSLRNGYRPRSVYASLSVLSGLARFLYLECDAIRALETLIRRVEEEWGRKTESTELVRCLDPLVERGLMLEQDGRYLSLAVRLGDYEPSRPLVNRFFAVAKELGEPTTDGLRVPLKRLNGSEGYLTAAERALAKAESSFPR